MATKSKKASQDAEPGTGNGKGRRPVHEIRLGKIRAAIWANQVEGNRGVTTRHNVTFTRLYLDGDNNWKDSGSFGRDDMPLVMKVADLAHSWIYQHANGSAEADTEPSPGSADDEYR